MDPELTQHIQANTLQAWLFIPGAILLGALHGLEPGHSKSLMAAFIVAIRGTPRQAMLLGVAAAISHTAIVWLIVILGVTFGRRWIGDSEPYLHLLAALLMIGLALTLVLRRRPDHTAPSVDHDHKHDHHDGHRHAPHHDHKNQHLETNHDDAHTQAHARQLQEMLLGSGNQVTTWQIIAFGLSGGLLPCPAAITVLLLCLQFEQISLGIALVLAFSVGLALTLVGVGIFAALGTRHAGHRWPGLATLTTRAPYYSGLLILGIGLYSVWRSLLHIAAL